MDFLNISLWVGTGIMCFAAFCFFFLAIRRKPSQRKFEGTIFMIAGVSAASYLTTAVGLGRIKMGYQEMFIPLYFDCLITTPLLLYILLEICGSQDHVMAIGCNFLMIIFRFIGACVPPDYYTKYIFFAISVLCLLYILSVLNREQNTQRYGKDAATAYFYCSWITIITWSLYPVVWLLSDYMGVMSVSLAAITYVALDFFSKVIFGFILLGNRVAVNAVLNHGDGYVIQLDMEPSTHEE